MCPSRIGIGILVACMFCVALPAASEDKEDKAKVSVEEWLLLGPVPTPYPAFSDENGVPKGGSLLDYGHVNRRSMRPVSGGSVPTVTRGPLEWKRVSSQTGRVQIETKASPHIAYLSTYVEVPRWMKVDLTVNASHAFDLWVNGESIVKRDEPGNDEKSASTELTQGKHTLLVKTVFVPGDSAVDWTFGLEAKPGEDFESLPAFSTSPRRRMTIQDVLDGPSIRNVQVSTDGDLFALSMEKRQPPKGTEDRWVDIRRFKDGSLVRTLRDVSASSWQWAPRGQRLSYVTRKDGASTLRVMNVASGSIETVVENVEDFSNYQWSPDGSFIAYSINEKAEEDKTGVKRMRRVSDRRAGDRDRSYLYVASFPSGSSRRVTAGDYGTRVYDLHPNNRDLIIGRSYEDLSNRPYSREEVYRLDLETAAVELMWEGSWMGGFQWSPDGEKILATGGPSAFGGAGTNVPAGMIANDYDRQAFLLDPKTKSVDPITKDFDPTIYSVYWPAHSRDIFAVAEDGEFVRLFRYDIRKRSYKPIDIDCDVIGSRDVAADKPVAVLVGAKANRPPRLYGVDLESGRVRELLDPAAERFDDIDIGEVRDFNFTTSDGTEIAGRVHLPPDFDESQQWPCIVYYYGGTATVTRSFGGRYPKNLWAAHGYVVYVLQPSGATGFGQEFSARHVNDWGKRVSEEIIEGTRQFLAAHDFVDAERVGCIGASFGGFMTELLVTKTDMFAAAVSHAGISMISSYWGEGYWGYGYNAVSAANSFPWNRPDIYVDQSPLFGVENVTTPLLLLHGGSDTNVPPGESEQMYTALKLLGKEVEYLRIADQNHWIVDYEKRVIWSNAIVSWFDRWLKNEPEWWNNMYPPVADDE